MNTPRCCADSVKATTASYSPDTTVDDGPLTAETSSQPDASSMSMRASSSPTPSTAIAYRPVNRSTTATRAPTRATASDSETFSAT